jgi:hypothetical protein
MIDPVTNRHVPRRALLTEPFRFFSDVVGWVTVPAGFDTDYASIPRALWSIYPPDGEYTEAAVVHDFLYWQHAVSTAELRKVTREEADDVFLEALALLGVPLARRRLMYRAVRVGGAGPWAKAERQRLGLEEFTPVVHRIPFRNRK